ncbi:radical SAM protein [Candidatus Woesearchaeota archaeon]|nr:radical SAM protein [Candidatus Woesearchaeota archaeon]
MSSKYYNLLKMVLSRKPSYVIFFVTAKCNSRCKMCFNWKNIEESSKKKELSLEEIKKISRNFDNFQYLTISGGEPFLRDDLVEIIQLFVKNNNVQFVSIPTNALMPGKIREFTERLLKSCPKTSFRVSLSIDGIGEHHDKIRGVKGNFKKVLESYKKLDPLRKKYNHFNLDTSTVFSYYNQDRVVDVFKWVNANLKVDNHILGLVRGNTKEKIAKNISIKKFEEAAKFVEGLTAKKGRRRKDIRLKLLIALKLVMREIIINTLKCNRMIIPCTAGKRMVVLTEEGDVYPCELLNMKMGSLREADYNIKNILNSKNSKKIVQWIKKTKCYCTFECAIQNSLIYNFKQYPEILKKFLKIK